MPHLEIIKKALVHYIVNNDYQKDWRVLYKFIPNKSFGQLLNISPKNSAFLKTLNSKFSYIEVWFTDQNSKPPEIKDKINIIVVNHYSVNYKKWCAIQFNQEINYL